MGVPVTMPAPVVGTRVRREATDAKPDLISYQRRPAIRAAFLFAVSIAVET
jgi:hypothetical protein